MSKQPHLRKSAPGEETTEGYFECTHCGQRTHWEAGSILHRPGCIHNAKEISGADFVHLRLLSQPTPKRQQEEW